MTKPSLINVGQILTGALFNEPMRIETLREDGDGVVVAGLVGTKTERFRSVRLTPDEIQGLTILDTTASFDGDGKLVRLGL